MNHKAFFYVVVALNLLASISSVLNGDYMEAALHLLFVASVGYGAIAYELGLSAGRDEARSMQEHGKRDAEVA